MQFHAPGQCTYHRYTASRFTTNLTTYGPVGCMKQLSWSYLVHGPLVIDSSSREGSTVSGSLCFGNSTRSMTARPRHLHSDIDLVCGHTVTTTPQLLHLFTSHAVPQPAHKRCLLAARHSKSRCGNDQFRTLETIKSFLL